MKRHRNIKNITSCILLSVLLLVHAVPAVAAGVPAATDNTKIRGISNSNSVNGGQMTSDDKYVYLCGMLPSDPKTKVTPYLSNEAFSDVVRRMYIFDKNSGDFIESIQLNCYEINKVDDTLYYVQNGEDALVDLYESNSDKHIMRANIEKYNIRDTKSIYTTSGDIYSLIAYDDELFWIEISGGFVDNQGVWEFKGESYIKKMEIGSEEVIELNSSKNYLSSLNIDNGTLYYLSDQGEKLVDPENPEGEIIKHSSILSLNPDGAGHATVLENVKYLDSGYVSSPLKIIVDGGKIYYCSMNDDMQNFLTLYDIKSETAFPIVPLYRFSCNVSDNQLYYSDAGMNSMDIGSGNTKYIADIGGDDIFVEGKTLFSIGYADGGDAFWLLNLKNKRFYEYII